MPTFAKGKGQFIESKDRIKDEQGLLKRHLLNHKKNLQYLLNCRKHLSNAIFQQDGSLLNKSIRRNILLTLYSNNLQQLQCKNKKLHQLIPNKKSKKNKNSYTIPVISLSSEDLDTKPLKYGLHHSFTDKNKYVKRNIALELESLVRSLIKFVDQSLKEFFHKSLRSSTNVLAKNIYSDKDTTFKSLNSLRKNNDIVVLAADKESCTVILNKDNYINKVGNIIDDGVKQMKYVETTDDTCNELKRFQDFLYRHFYKHKYYEEKRPRSNQPVRFFATAKTHKFKSISDITLE